MKTEKVFLCITSGLILHVDREIQWKPSAWIREIIKPESRTWFIKWNWDTAEEKEIRHGDCNQYYLERQAEEKELITEGPCRNEASGIGRIR